MPNTAPIIGSGPNKLICLNAWFGHDLMDEPAVALATAMEKFGREVLAA